MKADVAEFGLEAVLANISSLKIFVTVSNASMFEECLVSILLTSPLTSVLIGEKVTFPKKSEILQKKIKISFTLSP